MTAEAGKDRPLTDPEDRLVERFDWHDPEYTPETAEIINRRIREKSAVTYSSAHGGFWILSRYEDVKAALSDHETFSSGSGVHFPRAAGMPKFCPIDYDPPEHGFIRAQMTPPLKPRMLLRLESLIQELAADLVRPLVERGSGDLVSEVARPFAIRSLGITIGLSEAAQEEIRALTRTLWKHLSEDSDSSRFWPAYHALLADEIERTRREPGDYYLSHLATTRVDGEFLADELLYAIIASFCIAGHDNTMNTLSRMFWHLSANPQLQVELRGSPELMSQVAEETLRRWCPTDRFTRVTTRAVEIDGITIPEASRVVLLFDAANRDPTKFPEPDHFLPERGNAHQHLSFGDGLHRCMGIQLARMEFKAVLGELALHPVYRRISEPVLSFENGRHVLVDAIRVEFDESMGSL